MKSMIADQGIKYLFIAGCARSGTTILAKFIGSHQQVVMGIERFSKLEKEKNFKLKKTHFTPNRFLDVRDTDRVLKMRNWDDAFVRKVESMNYKYIGDKQPGFFLVYDKLFSEFPEAKILFIFRDVEEVMNSWQNRVKKGTNWPATKDFKQALIKWEVSIENTLQAMKEYPNQIAPINYKDFFKKYDNFSPILDWLGLTIDSSTHQSINNYKNFTKRAPQKIPDYITDYAKEHARFELYEEINQLSLGRKINSGES